MGIFSHTAEDDVQVTASFPDTNPFGLVVNGEQNGLLIHLANQGKKNYTLVSASASYHDVNNHWATVKNVSTLKYNVPIVAGSNLSAPYQVYSEFKPQELGLTVWVNLIDSSSDVVKSAQVPHQITAMNQTVSIVEPTSTWFDPGLLFLYLVLSTALLGGAYAIYQQFFAPTPTKKTKQQQRKVKAVVASEDKSVYPNVKPYEEEWIPESHLKNRSSKLKKKNNKSGNITSDNELQATSGGEVTSGGEASGTEIKVKSSKKKGKKA
ncbi:uncharacterized protein L201_004216 [Kwoniella dendrophila CBS 6074]|uniref:Translocon-associated protein subunit alpha n=1 Tax=Kwoniella dendrophila CBS 6074 TaxID=1295534 RepID=A0AAX4JXP0_9TREE